MAELYCRNTENNLLKEGSGDEMKRFISKYGLSQCVHELLIIRQASGLHICPSKRIDYEYQECQPHAHDSPCISIALRTMHNKTGKVRINVTLRRVRVAIVTVEKKAISITRSEYVFATLGIQHAMCIRYIVICGLPALQNFSTLSHKRQDFRKKKKVLNINCVF